MEPARKKGITRSGVGHVVLLLLIILGLPTLFMDAPLEEPMAITVDILPVAAVSNVKPSESTPAPKKDDQKKPPQPQEKPEEKKPEEPKPAQPKPNPPTKSDKAPPPPPKETEKPAEKKPEEKKPEEKKPEKKPEEKKPDKKAKEDPLDALLKDLKESTPESKEEAKPSKSQETSSSDKKSRSNHFDPNSKEALSIRDSIANQVYKCWNVPAGARDASKLIIEIEVEYRQDGTPISAVISDKQKSQYQSDPYFRAAADSARRAVLRCAPLQGMPANSFNMWQYPTIVFDPQNAL